MPEPREAEQAGLALLRDAYPDRRDFARAERWLGWIAWRMGTGRSFGWWDIPDWLGEKGLRYPRLLLSLVIIEAGYSAGFAGYLGRRGLLAGPLAMVIAGYLASKIRPGRLRRLSPPRAMRPRLPRSWREAAAALLAVLTGIGLRPVLIRQWSRPVTEEPDGTPDGSYRACRTSTAIDVLACLATGLPLTVVALLLAAPWLVVVATAVAAVALLAALADGKAPALWEANLYWLIYRGRWPGFGRLLRDATRSNVLQQAGARYDFTDPAVQRYLAGLRQAGIDTRGQLTAERRAARQARRTARVQRYDDAVAATDEGIRRKLLTLLSRSARDRLTLDLGSGVAAATLAGVLTARVPTWHSVPAVLGGLLLAVILAFIVWLAGLTCVVAVLVGVTDRLRWSLWLTGRMSPRNKVVTAAGAVCAAGLVTLASGPAAMRHAIAVAAVAVMSPLTVAVTGGWAAVLIHLRWQAAGNRVLRHVADVLAAAVTGVVILLLVKPDLLGAQAAAGLLFPVAVWLSVRAWRAMDDSDRVAVRAAADIAVSVLLGAALTGLLAWLASQLRMPPEEVTVLRDAIGKTGRLLDVRWWIWASAYAVLAGLSLAFATWPVRLGRVLGWFTRLRVVPSAEVMRRGATGAHIGLLLVLLIGAAGPAAIGPVLRARLAERYTQTLTDIARERAQTAEYRTIAGQLPLLRPVLLIPLADLVLDVHKTSRQPGSASDPSAVELDLAQRLGRLQATTLTAASPPPVEQAEAAAARDAGLRSPAGDSSEEIKRLGELGDAEHEEDIAKKQAEQAGELAATALATALRLPGLGDSEVIGIVREYLSSLIEFSPLRDVLAAWAERLSGRSAPPDATELVVPDPVKLRDAAAAQVNGAVATHPVSDPLAVAALLGESGIAGAVDLTNQTRYLQESGSGPCDACARPEPPADHAPAPEEHVFP